MKEDGEKIPVRRVDNAEYIGVLKELLLKGREVSLVVSGNSMVPFLVHQRDIIILSPVENTLGKGDVVLYQRPDGSYILHRIVKVQKDGTFDITGDAQTQIEKGVLREQIFARVTAIQRKGVWIHPGDPWWFFFKHIWIHMIRFRPLIMKTVSKLKRKKS